MTISAFVFMCLAIAVDTAFYLGNESASSSTTPYKRLWTSPVITPWNNIRYNTQTSNLALHGLHPHYQHFLANLPQLLGPAIILLFTSLQPLSMHKLRLAFSNPRFLSAITGTAFLSILPHQEPRFLLPCVPLLLTCVRLPSSDRRRKWFWAGWLTFNVLFGALMGIYHQGGVIPAQLQVPEQVKSFHLTSNSSNISSATVFWWKTYPPPTYLLGNIAPLNISTIALMGLPPSEMLSKLSASLPSTCIPPPTNDSTEPTPRNSQMIFLIAPLSSRFFPPSATNQDASFTTAPATSKASGATREKGEKKDSMLKLSLAWTYRKHINLDDIDIGEDGIWGTIGRVVGRRGIGIWSVQRLCWDPTTSSDEDLGSGDGESVGAEKTGEIERVLESGGTR
jgi:GPI mannosyltransferase 4